MKKINKSLAFFSGIFLLFSFALFAVIGKLSPLFSHVAYYCQSFVEAYLLHLPSSGITIFYIGVTTITGLAFIKFILLTIRGHILKRRLMGMQVATSAYQKVIQDLGLQKKTILIQTDSLFAFCLGIRKPTIYLSTGLVSQLTRDELEAVLRHEQYHIENYDTVTILVASVVHTLFPFFPLLGDFIQAYRIEREIKADTFAIQKTGNEESLVSALRKLLTIPTLKAAPIAAFADEGTLEPRIYALLNKTYQRNHVKRKHLIITLLSGLLLIVVLITPVHAEDSIDHTIPRSTQVILCASEVQCSSSCQHESKRQNASFTSKINASYLYSTTH